MKKVWTVNLYILLTYVCVQLTLFFHSNDAKHDVNVYFRHVENGLDGHGGFVLI